MGANLKTIRNSSLTMLVLLLCQLIKTTEQIREKKMCSGTVNSATQIAQEFESPIVRLKELYENCSIVDGNLEIVKITEEDIEKSGGPSALDFLQSIEQVNGYVLLYLNHIKNLSIPNLRIIWGDNLYKPVIFGADVASLKGEYGLFINDNQFDTLDLRSLRVVHGGEIGLFFNPFMCYWRTLDYRQLLGDSFEGRIRHTSNFNKCDKPAACSNECQSCFGPSPSQCQKIYRTNCAGQCSSGMCFNSTVASPQYCCHAECTGGCYGPSDEECFGCNKFQNGQKCVDRCPSPEQYVPSKTEYEKNPNGTYAYQRICLATCPSHTVVYRDGCVSRCPENYYTSDDRVCLPCKGNCPKVCVINDMITGDNIGKFENCTKVQGYIGINQASFQNGSHYGPTGKRVQYQGITVDDLELLSNVQIVTDYVIIQAGSHELESLNFLRNLHTIEGRKLFENKVTLDILSNEHLRYLGMVNLKSVLNGMIVIGQNYDLCFIHNIPWTEIGPHNPSVSGLRSPVICKEEGFSCDPACDSTKGCWGPGPNMCYSCKQWKLNNTCVESCLAEDGLYESSGKVCEPCHKECLTCNGSTARNCFQCRHARLHQECVSECPPHSYYLEANTKTCEKCHENCYAFGCTGGRNFVGFGGCNKCKYGVYNADDHSVSPCLYEISDNDHCSKAPDLFNYYWAPPTSIKHHSPLVEHGICMKCLNVCKSCSGYGQNEEHQKCVCLSHRVFRRDTLSLGAECAFRCPENYYNVKSPTDSNVTDCYPCHSQCADCTGPASTDCVQCKSYKFQIDEKDNTFNCTDVCPPDRPYMTSEKICSDINFEQSEEKKRYRTHIIIAVALSAMCMLLIVVCVVAFVLRRRTVMLEKLNHPDEYYEMKPEAKPDLSQLRLIVELELKKGGILGYGAFGTVFKGIYTPTDKDKMKIPVAIKVLHEATDQKEMLDEAGFMARVNHPYLVRLLGVCLGQQMMLVTPLMPLGNLLDYLQNNRAKVGSSALLRWCSQIASGMAYLEELRLVHRDLAARNVLVQNPYHIRITDFGLAKMLEYGEQEINIAEGKMPIKWLALECIQYRRYTHKSDVWAYGVTVWELLTFGDKPYKDVQLLQIPALLEKGERLSQPKICTLDVYMILIKCWMVDADSRPTFKELHETFSKMSKDPGRYLVIEGDKLLRLPSYTTQDQRDMMVQFVDDPDVCDPEDYLHQISVPSSPTSPVEPMKLAMNDVVHFRDGLRLPSTSSHRYASDPLKPKNRNVITMDLDNYLVPDSQNLPQALAPESDAFPNVTYTPVFTGQSSNDSEKHVYYNELPDQTVLKRPQNLPVGEKPEFEEYLIPNGRQKNGGKFSSPSKRHYLNSKETEEFLQPETVL